MICGIDVMEEDTTEFILPMNYLWGEQYIRNSIRWSSVSHCAQQAQFFFLAKTVPTNFSMKSGKEAWALCGVPYLDQE